MLADKGQMGGHLGAFIAPRRLGDLHDHLVPYFQIQRSRRGHGTVVLGIIGIRLVHGQVAISCQSATHKRRLHTRKHVGDFAFIDIADDLALLLVLDGKFRQAPVLQKSRILPPAISVEKPFLFHECLRFYPVGYFLPDLSAPFEISPTHVPSASTPY